MSPHLPAAFLSILADDPSTEYSEKGIDGLFLSQSRKSTDLFLLHRLQTNNHLV